MYLIKITVLITSWAFVFAPPTWAQNIPAPIHGVTFEEWAAANARIANNMDKSEVENILGVTETQFQEVDAGFTKAWKESPDPQREFSRLYGEAFANPNSGRFAKAPMQVAQKGKLATFEDYARVQGHLQAAVKFGIDPQKVLEEHGLTVYEFSQEAGQWVQKLATQAKAGGDGQSIMQWHDRLAFYEEQYSKGYAKP
ncbi:MULTISPECIES: hypothetical protein [Rhizobium/Agrobacterium group]|uniref:Uncharacterized protein n=1 Tax=Agrobacterium vitis TaxID=373 RepID=A0ABD6H719_AGRVI|nr:MULTISPECIES: hypothetical protein [Rhizobium/Agrobacterium group]MCF1446837.1 hypothetical protein [Allorhizobium ampelinum]MCF1491724.1 hypothetical protein [Allorhizobium ampelinum]MUO28892.1 hypothetical protein [Agrobacterium vitis]MUO43258.1 hypothetical protein [Agrobacterium vitis]MUP09862.1 hypothetical protein [Agrobacterium vitis]